MNKANLAARRAALIERCAEQRVGLAFELDALRPSKALAGLPLAGYVAANRKLVLGAAGTALGLVLMRRKRLVSPFIPRRTRQIAFGPRRECFRLSGRVETRIQSNAVSMNLVPRLGGLPAGAGRTQ